MAMATPRMEGLGRFALRGLPIAPSNMSLVELLRSEWVGGAAAAAAWIQFDSRPNQRRVAICIGLTPRIDPLQR